MSYHRIKIFVLFSALALAAALGLWFTTNHAQSASQRRDWPSFEMVYKTWHLYNGQARSPSYSVTRLTYTDQLHWRAETLEDTAAPDNAGNVMEVSGDIVKSSFVEVLGDTAKGIGKRINASERKVDSSEGFYAPDDWLIPIRISKYKQYPGATIRPTDTPGLLEITFAEQVPCDSDLEL